MRARADEVALAVSRVPLTHVHPHWDVSQVARKMSDFNLTVVPVLDDEHAAVVGVVTVDDLLERAPAPGLAPRVRTDGGRGVTARPAVGSRSRGVRLKPPSTGSRRMTTRTVSRPEPLGH